jgi:hypothetical protein
VLESSAVVGVIRAVSTSGVIGVDDDEELAVLVEFRRGDALGPSPGVFVSSSVRPRWENKDSMLEKTYQDPHKDYCHRLLPVLNIVVHAGERSALFHRTHSTEKQSRPKERGVWKKVAAGRIWSE